MRPTLASLLLLSVTALAQSSDFSAVLAQAQAANAKGKYEEARKILHSIPKDKMKDCFDCLSVQSATETGLGEMKDALNSADRALAIASNDNQKSAAAVLRATTLLSIYVGDPRKSKPLSDAEATLRQALTINPKNAPAEYFLGIVLLKEKRDPEGAVLLKQVLNDAPATSPYRHSAELLIENPRRAREPFAPDFELTTKQGNAISLKSLAGKVVVIDFWATWCPPCRESVPELKDLTRKYPADKLP